MSAICGTTLRSRGPPGIGSKGPPLAKGAKQGPRNWFQGPARGQKNVQWKNQRREMKPPGIGSKGPKTANRNKIRHKHEPKAMKPPGVGSKGPKRQGRVRAQEGPKESKAMSDGTPRNWFQGAQEADREPNTRSKQGANKGHKRGQRSKEEKSEGTPRNWFQGAQEAKSSSEHE